MAASATTLGPSVSGKPCPRLIAPVRTASADISAKIVVPKPCRRDVRNGTSPMAPAGYRRVGSDQMARRVDGVHVQAARRHLAPQLAGGAIERLCFDVEAEDPAPLAVAT